MTKEERREWRVKGGEVEARVEEGNGMGNVCLCEGVYVALQDNSNNCREENKGKGRERERKREGKEKEG